MVSRWGLSDDAMRMDDAAIWQGCAYMQDGVNKALEWCHKGAVSLLRDRIILPPLHRKFGPVDIKVAETIFRDRFTEHYSRRMFKQDVECDGVWAQFGVVEYKSSEGENTHVAIRVGGADEVLALSHSRIKPYLKAHIKELDGKGLHFYQVTIRDMYDENGDRWRPDSFVQFSDLFFALLKELGHVDTIIAHSLGATVFEGLELRDPKDVPKNLVLDRSLPSLWKVGRTTHSVGVCCLLYRAARSIGFDTNPEVSVAAFCKQTDMRERKIVVIEVENDYYFSGLGKLGEFSKVTDYLFQHTFVMEEFRNHNRSHHAGPISFVINHENAPIVMGGFSVDVGESAVDAIARQIFSKFGKSEVYI
jgi:hypothetical protein